MAIAAPEIRLMPDARLLATLTALEPARPTAPASTPGLPVAKPLLPIASAGNGGGGCGGCQKHDGATLPPGSTATTGAGYVAPPKSALALMVTATEPAAPAAGGGESRGSPADICAWLDDNGGLLFWLLVVIGLWGLSRSSGGQTWK